MIHKKLVWLSVDPTHPLGHARLVLRDARTASLVALLSQAHTVAELVN